MVGDYLSDTNIILRSAFPSANDHPAAIRVVQVLRSQGITLCVTPQNLIEFWNDVTRPAERNGFGLTVQDATSEVKRIESLFKLLPDTPAIYPEWLSLVSSLGVSGVKVHHARLAAVMRVHGIQHILTFNTVDFKRFPGITAVHPNDVPL